MPLTPLHFGLLAPINYLFPGRVSTVSFTVTTLMMDARLIKPALAGMPIPGHGPENTFIIATTLAVFLACLGVRSRKWGFGVFFGAYTHVVLDAMVHGDIEPFLFYAGNPFYIGNMHLVSLALLPFMVWFIAQNVSYSLDWLQRHWVAFRVWLGWP